MKPVLIKWPNGLNLSKPTHFVSYGFGSGLSAIAPGTAGSAAAVLLWWILGMSEWSDTSYLVFVFACFVLGIDLVGRTAQDLKIPDPGGIVWDEFVGMWLALYTLPQEVLPVLLVFAFFRLFDAVKKGPVGWCDRHIKGGLGIMFDDLVAGAMAWCVTQAALWALG